MMKYYFTLIIMTNVIGRTMDRTAHEMFDELKKIKDKTVKVESLFDSDEKMQHRSNDKIIDITDFIKNV